jgi:putative membrane protein
MRIAILMAAGLLMTACEGQDTAQTGQPQARMDTEAADGAGMAGQQVTSAEYVQRAAMSDMFEIESGNLALERGNAEDIRSFAQMMVADHTASSRDLRAALERSGVRANMPASLDAEHQAKMNRLRTLEGADFDREYMSQQLTGHRDALALHQGYSQNGDDEALRQFAQQAVPVVQRHYERLQREGAGTTGGGTGAAGQTGTTTQ